MCQIAEDVRSFSILVNAALHVIGVQLLKVPCVIIVISRYDFAYNVFYYRMLPHSCFTVWVLPNSIVILVTMN